MSVPRTVYEGELKVSPGFHVKRRWLKKLKDAYTKIIKQKGDVAPKDLLDAARPKRSPIHGMFEWDDTKAAEQFRLQQASYLIRSIRVSLTIVGGGATTFRPLVSVVKEGVRTYLPVVRALNDPGYRAQILSQAIRELEAFQTKYAKLKELTDIFSAINKLKKGWKK